MSNTTYRDRTDRWRPTLPEPKRLSVASRGLARAGFVETILGWTMLILLLVLSLFGRATIEMLGFQSFASLFLLLLAPITLLTAVVWRVTGRTVRAALAEGAADAVPYAETATILVDGKHER